MAVQTSGAVSHPACQCTSLQLRLLVVTESSILVVCTLDVLCENPRLETAPEPSIHDHGPVTGPRGLSGATHLLVFTCQAKTPPPPSVRCAAPVLGTRKRLA